ncbi:uncharacterized protein LOC142979580 [Anticarsia gemmatalis]|uniref:uncharacterized protein LOC142979580 n=1 Tax=Anticarsia gemmatalis TaxID=129554 RepID=UPI003F76CCD8
MAWSTVLTLACVVAYVQAHGRLMDPPNRGSLWRFDHKYAKSPANYDDDGMNCGGFYHQWSVNGGKCGICGDPYDQARPRQHELGGKYGLGYIVADYEAGQLISTNVYLSASHLGFWELRICPEPEDQTQECFDNGYLLELEEGGTKYYPKRGDGSYNVNYWLPSGFTCDHCVLQWQYTAGNNWGVCSNGTQGLGCGNQEQFYTCSDIAISKGGSDNDIDEGHDTTESPNTEATDAPLEVSSPLFDHLTQGFLDLNPIGEDLEDIKVMASNDLDLD